MHSRLLLTAALAAAMAAPAAAQSVQQRFEAATARLDANDPAGALAGFEKLEADLAASLKPSRQNLGLVRAGKGEALSALERYSEAIAAYRAALAGGALDAPAVASMRDRTLLQLAKLEEATLDLPAASATYQRFAEVAADPAVRHFALAGAARAAMFTDGPAALALAERAVVAMEALPDVSKEDRSIVLGTKGRVLLNAGQPREALKLLARAIILRGGMTIDVDLWDVALRADAALAALRAGREDEARRYLAYTGAGRTEAQLNAPVDYVLPDCADLDGFTPEDSVIVQFAILEDGRVVGAMPVLASRPGPAAVEFARLVGRWTWDPEAAKKIDPFYRVATRVELRCTNRRRRPRPTVELWSAFREWVAINGAALPDHDERSDAALVAAQRARLEAARKSGKAPALVAALWQLADNAIVPIDPSFEMIREAQAVLPTDAPPAVRLLLTMRAAALEANKRRDERGYHGALAESLRSLLSDPQLANDPRLRATVNLELARSASGARWRDLERSALLSVTGDAALGERDPLKVAALVMLANVEANAGDLEAARAAYARTGLTAEQCALIDGGPVLEKNGASSSDFPMEAMRWGFEGWTQMEYDIAADGSTRNVRAVMAYPPAIFAEAGTGILESSRYRAAYRPGNDLGCGGASQRLRFLIED